MSGNTVLEITSDSVASRCVTPDLRILSMLAERTAQAVAIFRPDLTPSYLNPALRRLLELGRKESLIPPLSRYQVELREIDGGSRPIAAMLHRRGEWHGEIHVRREDRPHWSLTLNGRVELLRQGIRKLGFAIVAREQAAATGAVAHKLTVRERDVLNALLAGGTSKTIAQRLRISHRTVEAHRFSIMRKFDVKSLPDLFRLTMQAEA